MSGYPPEPGPSEGEPRPYGAMPPVSPHEMSVTAPAPPQPVQRAANVLYVIVAWSVINLVLAFVFIDSAKDAIRDREPSLTESEIDTAATLGLGITAVFAIGFGVLYILCARKMLQGRNWGRIVPTVLIGIGLLFTLLGLGGGTSGASMIGLVIGIALDVAFLVFAWNRVSNDFFKAAQTPR